MILLIFLSALIQINAQNCTVSEFENVEDAVQRCTELILDEVVVPAGKTLLLNLKDGAHVTFKGTTSFMPEEWEGPLVAISGSGVVITAEDDATIDGQGPDYWDGLGQWGSTKPLFFSLQLHDSIMSNIYIQNCPINCVAVVDSSNVTLAGWTVVNLEDGVVDNSGLDTDGFDFYNVSDVVLVDSSIYNQGLCVDLRCGRNILVDNIYCGYGQGIGLSVGLSSDSFQENVVENVTIRSSVLQGGSHAIQIRTFVDGFAGLIDNVVFSDVSFSGPTIYGINIQQNYRNLPPNATQPTEAKNNILIRNLLFDLVSGYADSSAVPIHINCAEEGCFDWSFNEVDIRGTVGNDCNYVPDGFNC